MPKLTSPFRQTMHLLKERDVTKQVVDFLAHRRWRPHRAHVGKFVPYAERDAEKPRVLSIGEEGDPDWLFVHPKHGPLYIELKAWGKKPSKLQKIRLEALRKEGFRAEWFDSLEGLESYYRREFGA